MQGRWVIAVACLLAGAAGKVPVPVEKMAEDTMADIQNNMASLNLAMDEADEETKEEKSIEASVSDTPGLGFSDDDVKPAAPQPLAIKPAAPQPVAMARLRKAMEDHLSKKDQSQKKVAVAEAAVVDDKKAAALKKRKEIAARLMKLEQTKAAELARIEKEEAQARQKMAVLKKEKADDEKRLKKAERLKAEMEAQHQAVVKAAEEAHALKRKAAKKVAASATPKLNVDAWVKKAVEDKFKKSGKHLSKDEAARIKEAFVKKLREKVEQRMKAKAKVASAPTLEAKAMVNVEKSVSKAKAKEEDEDDDVVLDDIEGSEENQQDESHNSEDSLQETDADVSQEETKSSEDKEQETTTESGTEEQEETDSETAGEEQEEANLESDVNEQLEANSETQDTEEATSEQSEQHDESGDVVADSADADTLEEEQSGTQGAEEESGEQDETGGVDADGDTTEEFESLLQKSRLRQPLFSTEDADVQQYLHPKTEVPRVHLSTGSHLQKRKHNVFDLSEATQKLEQFMAAEGKSEEDPKKKEEAPKDGEKEPEIPVAAAAPAPAPAAAPAPEPIDPYKMCNELCQFDSGMDGDGAYCITDCRSYVDAGGDLHSLKDFVTDESYNEQGGEKMEEHFEKVTGKSIPDCEPKIDLDPNTKFEVVDANGDGKLTREEMDLWGSKACVPNELAHQIFDVADSDFDNIVTPDEYGAIGEDTDIENTFDKWADKTTEGEDQYEPVQMPAFRHVDADSNGQLDRNEIMNMFKAEIQKRIPTLDQASVDALAAEHQQELLDDMDNVDKNEDGFISQEEYEAMHGGGMGEELSEAAAADNNLPDPDDLARSGKDIQTPALAPSPAGAAAPAPAKASFLSREAYNEW